MFNSAEHEILNAHKYTHIKKFCFFSGLEFCFFSGLDKPRMLFSLLINFNIYEQEKFHAQLS